MKNIILVSITLSLCCFTTVSAATDTENGTPSDATASQLDSKDTNKTNDALQFHLYPSILAGGSIDPSFAKWAHQRNKDYLARIKSQGGSYANYSIEYNDLNGTNDYDTQGGFSGPLGLGLNADIFYKNFGIGFSIPAFPSITIFDEYNRCIKDENGINKYSINYSNYYYSFAFTFYYRFYLLSSTWLGTQTDENKVFIKFGAGIDYSFMHYTYTVSAYGSNSAAPFDEEFNVDCLARRYGFHLNSALTFDLGLLTCSFSLNYSYALASKMHITGTHPGMTESSFGPVQTYFINMGCGINL
jgi:hypothetical protein